MVKTGRFRLWFANKKSLDFVKAKLSSIWEETGAIKDTTVIIARVKPDLTGKNLKYAHFSPLPH
ncbi:hypothetical protein [Paenibacillus typhae]|uniref:hypothetical protein n=1 Tax=Paenibacillus typhae TaxID=1174501 RepID=UPI001C8DC276|nr:hypothetical protein [Paenibacillus typhae]MBY0013097.1 hypothetical protein [Paenibacillus typhae]